MKKGGITRNRNRNNDIVIDKKYKNEFYKPNSSDIDVFHTPKSSMSDEYFTPKSSFSYNNLLPDDYDEKKLKTAINKHRRLIKNRSKNLKIDNDINVVEPKIKCNVKIISYSEYKNKLFFNRINIKNKLNTFFSDNIDIIDYIVNKISNLKSTPKSKSKSRKINKTVGGNARLSTMGNSVLDILHLLDRKHDFLGTLSQDITEYINTETTHIFSRIDPLIKDTYQNLYKSSNYEPDITIEILNKIMDGKYLASGKQNITNFMFIDIDDSKTAFDIFEDKKYIQKVDFNNITEAYTKIKEKVKSFYNYTDDKSKQKYILDIDISNPNLSGFEQNLYNQFAEHLYPFENAFDPHSSSTIIFPGDNQTEKDANEELFKVITNHNFNNPTQAPLKQNDYAIRDVTKKFLKFYHCTYNTNNYPFIGFYKLDAAIASIQPFKDLIDKLQRNQSPAFSNDVLFIYYNNMYGYIYKSSFNTIDNMRNCINIIIKYINFIDEDATDIARINDIKTKFENHLDNLINSSNSIFSMAINMIVYIYYTNKRNSMDIRKNLNEIVDILFDLKKAGDWGQSLFCSKYNEEERNKECFFVSGDRLSAMRSILSANTKTIFSTDYRAIDDTTQTKKSVIGIYNNIPDLTFGFLIKYIKSSLLSSPIFNGYDMSSLSVLDLCNYTDTIDNIMKTDIKYIKTARGIDTNININNFNIILLIILYRSFAWISHYSLVNFRKNGNTFNTIINTYNLNPFIFTDFNTLFKSVDVSLLTKRNFEGFLGSDYSTIYKLYKSDIDYDKIDHLRDNFRTGDFDIDYLFNLFYKITDVNNIYINLLCNTSKIIGGVLPEFSNIKTTLENNSQEISTFLVNFNAFYTQEKIMKTTGASFLQQALVNIKEEINIFSEIKDIIDAIRNANIRNKFIIKYKSLSKFDETDFTYIHDMIIYHLYSGIELPLLEDNEKFKKFMLKEKSDYFEIQLFKFIKDIQKTLINLSNIANYIILKTPLSSATTAAEFLQIFNGINIAIMPIYNDIKKIIKISLSNMNYFLKNLVIFIRNSYYIDINNETKIREVDNKITNIIIYIANIQKNNMIILSMIDAPDFYTKIKPIFTDITRIIIDIYDNNIPELKTYIQSLIPIFTRENRVSDVKNAQFILNEINYYFKTEYYIITQVHDLVIYTMDAYYNYINLEALSYIPNPTVADITTFSQLCYNIQVEFNKIRDTSSNVSKEIKTRYITLHKKPSVVNAKEQFKLNKDITIKNAEILYNSINDEIKKLKDSKRTADAATIRRIDDKISKLIEPLENALYDYDTIKKEFEDVKGSDKYIYKMSNKLYDYFIDVLLVAHNTKTLETRIRGAVVDYEKYKYIYTNYYSSICTIANKPDVIYDINLFNEVLNDKLKKLTKTYNNIILNIRKNYTTDADVLSSDSYFNEDLKRSFDNYSIVSSFYKTNNAKINEYIINIKDNDLDVTTIQPLEIMPIDGDDVVDEYRRSTSSDGSPQQQQARAGPNPIMQQQRQRRGEGATQVNSGKTLIRELSYKLANASELYNLSKISDINTVVKDIKHYLKDFKQDNNREGNNVLIKKICLISYISKIFNSMVGTNDILNCLELFFNGSTPSAICTFIKTNNIDYYFSPEYKSITILYSYFSYLINDVIYKYIYTKNNYDNYGFKELFKQTIEPNIKRYANQLDILFKFVEHTNIDKIKTIQANKETYRKELFKNDALVKNEPLVSVQFATRKDIKKGRRSDAKIALTSAKNARNALIRNTGSQ